jgi:hypothetical protein
MKIKNDVVLTIKTIKKYKCELCNRDDGIDDSVMLYVYHDGLLCCESCITDIDDSKMFDAVSIDLYLDGKVLSNGVNTLKIMIDSVKKSNNRMFGLRYDIWFKYAGKNWHGIKMGNDYFNVVKCKVKKVAKF